MIVSRDDWQAVSGSRNLSPVLGVGTTLQRAKPWLLPKDRIHQYLFTPYVGEEDEMSSRSKTWAKHHWYVQSQLSLDCEAMLYSHLFKAKTHKVGTEVNAGVEQYLREWGSPESIVKPDICHLTTNEFSRKTLKASKPVFCDFTKVLCGDTKFTDKNKSQVACSVFGLLDC